MVIHCLSTSLLRVNRPLIVWLAARRQGPPRCAAVHLDDARFAKDRWRLRLHAGSVTVIGGKGEYLRTLNGYSLHNPRAGCSTSWSSV